MPLLVQPGNSKNRSLLLVLVSSYFLVVSAVLDIVAIARIRDRRVLGFIPGRDWGLWNCSWVDWTGGVIAWIGDLQFLPTGYYDMDVPMVLGLLRII